MIPLPEDLETRLKVRVWISDLSRRFHDHEQFPCRGDEPCDETGYCDRHNREQAVLTRLIRMRLARLERAKPSMVKAFALPVSEGRVA